MGRVSLQAVPTHYLRQCGEMPVTNSPAIDDIKVDMLRLEALLIDRCELHRALVDWLERELD